MSDDDSSKQRRLPKSLVFFWYVPIVIVLAMGTWLSFQGKTTESIVDKAKSFQGEQEASRALEPILATRYNLTVNLDESFTLTGNGLDEAGSLRTGDILEIPYTVEGIPKVTLGSLRLEMFGDNQTPIIAGFTRMVRSCETPWEKNGRVYQCNGPSHIVVSRADFTSDSFALMDEGDSLMEDGRRFYLIQIGKSDELILPVKGYKTGLTLSLSAFKAPEK